VAATESIAAAAAESIAAAAAHYSTWLGASVSTQEASIEAASSSCIRSLVLAFVALFFSAHNYFEMHQYTLYA
jgi:hypothetical protein